MNKRQRKKQRIMFFEHSQRAYRRYQAAWRSRTRLAGHYLIYSSPGNYAPIPKGEYDQAAMHWRTAPGMRTWPT